MHKSFLSLVILFFCVCVNVFAATSLDLGQQHDLLKNTILTPGSLRLTNNAAFNNDELKETNRALDNNQTLHIRIKQLYLGYEVWNGDGIVHIQDGKKLLGAPLSSAIKSANVSMNGKMYLDLQSDLQNSPSIIFNKDYANKVIQFIQEKYLQKQNFRDKNAKLIVYIDKQTIAHWAFLISFENAQNDTTIQPTYIINATNFTVYLQWDDVQSDFVYGGGFGGNEKTGKYIYDGLPNHYPKQRVNRIFINDMIGYYCFSENDSAVVKAGNDKPTGYLCNSDPAAAHGNTYFDDDRNFMKNDARPHNCEKDDNYIDATARNGGYSATLDALYAADTVTNMFEDWYELPPLMNDNKKMLINIQIRVNNANAQWRGKDNIILLGNGFSLDGLYYPFTSLGVITHEIAHGFTQQHSHLNYVSQSGGINESFSDMAWKAAEYYTNKPQNWMIGDELVRVKDQALRFMDDPKKDCTGITKACSIDNIDDYNDTIQVHRSSGIFNKVFVLLAQENDWNIKKAFNVMVQANRFYWTPNVTFYEAACGVMKATKDYKYDERAVTAAFAAVGINTNNCL